MCKYNTAKTWILDRCTSTLNRTLSKYNYTNLFNKYIYEDFIFTNRWNLYLLKYVGTYISISFQKLSGSLAVDHNHYYLLR